MTLKYLISKSKLFSILGGILFLFACDTEGRYPGFTKTSSGLEYKIISLGDGDQLPQENNMIVSSFEVKTLNDELLFSNKGVATDYAIEFFDRKDAGWMEAYSKLRAGDSACFIMKTDKLRNLPFEKRDLEVKLYTKIDRIANKERFLFELRFPELMIDYEMEEQELLMNFLHDLEPLNVINLEGMYYIIEKQGHGKRIEKGDHVVLHFEGFFLDGKKFDSTKDRHAAFDYVIGNQGQVLHGFDIGVRQLKQGAKATFILPSQLAFKEGGSSTGIIPPFTTVIYKVEVLEVHE